MSLAFLEQERRERTDTVDVPYGIIGTATVRWPTERIKKRISFRTQGI